MEQDSRRQGAPRKSAAVAPLCVEQGKAPRLVAFARIMSVAELSSAAPAGEMR